MDLNFRLRRFDSNHEPKTSNPSNTKFKAFTWHLHLWFNPFPFSDDGALLVRDSHLAPFVLEK